MLLYTTRQLRTRSPRSDKLRPNIPVMCSDNSIKIRARTHGFLTRLPAVIDCIHNLYPDIKIIRCGNTLKISTNLSLNETQAIIEQQRCVFSCADIGDETKWTNTSLKSLNNGEPFFIATRPIKYCKVEALSLMDALAIHSPYSEVTITTNQTNGL